MRKMILLLLLFLFSACGKNTEYIKLKQPFEVEKPVIVEKEVEALRTIVQVECKSKRDRYNECKVPISVLNIIGITEISFEHCFENISYGLLNQNTVWVDEGCKAMFFLSDK